MSLMVNLLKKSGDRIDKGTNAFSVPGSDCSSSRTWRSHSDWLSWRNEETEQTLNWNKSDQNILLLFMFCRNEFLINHETSIDIFASQKLWNAISFATCWPLKAAINFGRISPSFPILTICSARTLCFPWLFAVSRTVFHNEKSCGMVWRWTVLASGRVSCSFLQHLSLLAK